MANLVIKNNASSNPISSLTFDHTNGTDWSIKNTNTSLEINNSSNKMGIQLNSNGQIRFTSYSADNNKIENFFLPTPTESSGNYTILTNKTILATAAEINYLQGVTNSIQTQLNSKQDTITGAVSTLVNDNLNTNIVPVSNANGKLISSNITATELGYLDNVTSNIQTQLNARYRALGTKNGDLNNNTDIGCYWVQLSSCTNTPWGDNPSNKFGFLEVHKTGTSLLQRFTQYSSAGVASVWERTYNSSSDAAQWWPWTRTDVGGTLSVERGGTGVTTFTSGAALIGNGTGAIGERSITNMTTKGHITYNTNLMTTNTLAYWNGAYSSSNSSNLTYCAKGAFGDAAVKGVATSITSGGTNLATAGAVYDKCANYLLLAGGTLTGALTVPSPLKITHASTPAIYLQDADGNTVGSVFAAVSNSRTALRCYATDTAYYANYILPAAPTGLTGNKNYNVLTSQNPVTIAQGGTDATDAITAAANLGLISGLNLASTEYEIASNTDLNDVLNVGAYRVGSASIAASLTNAPPRTSSGFRLHVIHTTTSATRLQVAIYNSSTPLIYVRARNNNSVWGDWNKIKGNISYGTSAPSSAAEKGEIYLQYLS